MVTVYDVAEAVGLSIASVSRALNGQPGVSKATAERIREIADGLGYQPNEVARSLVAKSTQTIALLLPDITNPFFPELVAGVQEVVDREGHVLLLSNCSDSPDRIRHNMAVLRRKQVDGVIVVAGTLGNEIGDSVFGGVPTVFLDRQVAAEGTMTIGVDHETAAYDAVSHLIELGHTRIAHIAGPAGLAVADQRRQGWQRACEDSGLVADPALLVQGDFLEDGGHAAGSVLFGGDLAVTAVFAANDLTAIGLLAYAGQHGIDVPGDVSLIGMDGIQISRYTSPPLTTVAQPILELGRRAGELLLDAVRSGVPHEQHEQLPTRLVLGGTTRALDAAREQTAGVTR